MDTLIPGTGGVRMTAVRLALRERARQDEVWGGPEHDDTHSPAEWLDFIDEYASGIERGAKYSFPQRMVKVAALALAALEAELRKGNTVV